MKESINKLSFEIYKKQGESVTEIKKSYDFVNKVKGELGEQIADEPDPAAVEADEPEISVTLPNGDIKLTPTQITEVKKKEAEIENQVLTITNAFTNESAANKKILEKERIY